MIISDQNLILLHPNLLVIPRLNTAYSTSDITFLYTILWGPQRRSNNPSISFCRFWDLLI